MTLDVQLFNLLHGLAGHSAFLDTAIIFCAAYLGYVLILVFLAFVSFSLWPKRQKLEIITVAAVSMIIARYGVVELIRFFFDRDRPFVTLSFDPLISQVTSGSFPSGHAALFLALSTSVYLYNKKWGIAFLVATLLMGLSRVAAGVHYPSDILGGAIIGALVAYATFRVALGLRSKAEPIEA